MRTFLAASGRRPGWVLVLLLACAGLTPRQVAAAGAGVINEFEVNFGQQRPGGIALGSDGNLWFTESVDIGRLTPAQPVLTITDFPTTLIGPTPIAAGPDGNLWFTANGGGQSIIGRITPNGALTTFPFALPANAFAVGITAGPDGNVWWAEQNTGQIGRITTTGTITHFPFPSGKDSYALTAGPDGNVWFTEASASLVGRVTPTGHVDEFAAMNALIGITTGSDGNIWLSTSQGIGRITPGSDIATTFPTLTANAGVSSLASRPDGNVWFTATDAAGNRSAQALVPTTMQTLTVCTDRPSVHLSVTPNEVGGLSATVSGSNAAVLVQQLVFSNATNGLADTGTLVGQSNPFILTPQSPGPTITFTVRRVTPGLATTLFITVVDGCGSWSTFVGGAPSAF